MSILLAAVVGPGSGARAGHVSGWTSRVTVSVTGGQPNGVSWSPAVSGDGRYVAFTSYASNLVPGDTNEAPDVFVRDIRTGTTSRASLNGAGGQADGHSDGASISADGRYVAFNTAAKAPAALT